MAKNKRKIAIIEDELSISSMYKYKFEKSGYKVVTADDGEKGLSLVKQEKPDLVLLDIILTKMDGFSVLEELKKDKTVKDIPVILLTNLGQEEDVERGKKLGATAYYVKANLTPSELVDKIGLFFENN